MITFTPKKQKFIDSAIEMYGSCSTLSNQQFGDASKSAGVQKSDWCNNTYKLCTKRLKLPSDTPPYIELASVS